MPSEGACSGTVLEAAVALGPSNLETMGPEAIESTVADSGCAERSRVSPERLREPRSVVIAWRFEGVDLLFVHCG
jgi:hypothetical protein